MSLNSPLAPSMTSGFYCCLREARRVSHRVPRNLPKATGKVPNRPQTLTNGQKPSRRLPFSKNSSPKRFTASPGFALPERNYAESTALLAVLASQGLSWVWESWVPKTVYVNHSSPAMAAWDHLSWAKHAQLWHKNTDPERHKWSSSLKAVK